MSIRAGGRRAVCVVNWSIPARAAARIVPHAARTSLFPTPRSVLFLERPLLPACKPRAALGDPADRRRGRLLFPARLDRQVPGDTLLRSDARLGALRGAGDCDRAAAAANDALATASQAPAPVAD